MKLKEVIQQIENGVRRYDNMGAMCDYFKINDEIGIKVYQFANRIRFQKSINRHLLVLKKFRAAPKIYGSLTIKGSPAIIVEHCKIIRYIKDEYERRLRRTAIDVLLKIIKQEIPECFNDASDDHEGNVGINQAGYPVLIDFS